MMQQDQQYTTIIDTLIHKFAETEYIFLLPDLEDHELTQIFHELAEPIKQDFWEFYERDFDFDVWYDKDNNVIVIEPYSVLAAAALYRSFDDVWTFYNPEEDIYEDGFLRIFFDKESDNVVIIDYLGLHVPNGSMQSKGAKE